MGERAGARGVHGYIRALEEKNRERRLEQERRQSAEERRRRRLERGFTTHFSGANDAARRRASSGKGPCAACGSIAHGCCTTTRKEARRATLGGGRKSREELRAAPRSAPRQARRRTAALAEVGSQIAASRNRRTWGKIVEPRCSADEECKEENARLENDENQFSSADAAGQRGGKAAATTAGQERHESPIESSARGGSKDSASSGSEERKGEPPPSGGGGSRRSNTKEDGEGEDEYPDDFEELTSAASSPQEVPEEVGEASMASQGGAPLDFHDLEAGVLSRRVAALGKTHGPKSSSRSASTLSPQPQGRKDEWISLLSKSVGPGRRVRAGTRRPKPSTRSDVTRELHANASAPSNLGLGRDAELEEILRMPAATQSARRSEHSPSTRKKGAPIMPSWLVSNAAAKVRRSPIYKERKGAGGSAADPTTGGAGSVSPLELGSDDSEGSGEYVPSALSSSCAPTGSAPTLPSISLSSGSMDGLLLHQLKLCASAVDASASASELAAAAHAARKPLPRLGPRRPEDSDSGEPETPRTPCTPVASSRTEDERPSPSSARKSWPERWAQKQLPRGRRLRFNFVQTWGDVYYMGLTGLAVLVRGPGGVLSEVHVKRKRIRARPSDINVNGHSGDQRTLDKLVDGVNNTTHYEHMWLIEFTAGHDHVLEMDLGKNDFELAGVRVWNYNKSKEDTRRGVKRVHVTLDGLPLSPRDGFVFRKAPGTDSVDFGQTILFAESSVREPDLCESPYRFCGGHGFQPIAQPPPPRGSALRVPARQDWEAPLHPCGHMLRFDIFSCNGAQRSIGLDGIELYDGAGQRVDTDPASGLEFRVQAVGEARGSVPPAQGLLNGEAWLGPARVTVDIGGRGGRTVGPSVWGRVFIMFNEPIVLSMVKVWNYSRRPELGATELALYMDDSIIFQGELERANLHSGPHTMLFTDDPTLGESVRAFCGNHEQSVAFFNNGRAASGK